MRPRVWVLVAAGLLVAADAPKKDGGEAEAPTVAKEKEKLQGTWEIVSMEAEGREAKRKDGKKGELVFQGDQMTIRTKGKKGQWWAYTLDPLKSPRTIDLTMKGRDLTVKGIYVLEGDALKLCTGLERPTEFKSNQDEVTLILAKRDKR